MKQPPIFIINLKRDNTKRKHMVELCKKYNLEYEFIDGVDGGKLNDEQISDITNEKLSLKKRRRKLVRSEIGCALSHLKIYEKVIDEKISYCLILEDDVCVNNELLKILKLIDAFPKDWDIVLLGCYNRISIHEPVRLNFWSKKKINNFILGRPSEKGYGTHGYLVSYKGAKSIKSHLKKIHLPIDCYTGSDRYSNLYVISKPIISVNTELAEKYTSMKERDLIKIYNTFNLARILLKKLGVYHYLLPYLLKMSKFLSWLNSFKVLKPYK